MVKYWVLVFLLCFASGKSANSAEDADKSQAATDHHARSAREIEIDPSWLVFQGSVFEFFVRLSTLIVSPICTEEYSRGPHVGYLSSGRWPSFTHPPANLEDLLVAVGEVFPEFVWMQGGAGNVIWVGGPHDVFDNSPLRTLFPVFEYREDAGAFVPYFSNCLMTEGKRDLGEIY